MTVHDVLDQIDICDGKVVSKSTGRIYEVNDFINQICDRCKFTKKQRNELESYLISYVKPQSEQSKYVEKIIEKYDFQFSDGVYFIENKVISLPEIYRLMWKEEKLLPTEVDNIIENIEKISEEKNLQYEIFWHFMSKAKKGKSKYLASLYKIYPDKSYVFNFLHAFLIA